MPRMFDILRGKIIDSDKKKIKAPTDKREPNGKKEPTDKRAPTEKKDIDLTVSFPRQIRYVSSAKNDSNDTLAMPEKLIETIKKKGIDNFEIAKERYSDALGVVETLSVKVIKEESLDLFIPEVYETIDTLINQLILGDSLLENVAGEGNLDNYLTRHITNVCILSLAVGLQMRLNKSKLHTLGMAAILHDLGMLSLREIVEQPRELSADELWEVKEHPAKGVEIVLRLGSAYNSLTEIIQQHHERTNGQGYPLGLRGNQINDYAKIIGLVDTYEAMTHYRSFRQLRIPHQAVKELMHPLKPLFEPEIIKALIDKISIYPVGSFVKLNTQEIAKVITTNSTSPLRPLVLVILDAYGKRISELKTLDLSKNDSIYIKEPVLLNQGNELERLT